MKKIHLTFVLIAVLTLPAFSQLLPKKAYFRLEGKAGTESAMVLNLVKVDDSLYCDYPVAAGIFSPYTGKVQTDGTFTLRGFYDNEGDIIKGRFIDRGSVSGTLERKGDEKKIQIHMVEKYPVGSLALNVYYLSAIKPLVSKKGSPRATISQCVIVPGESSNAITSDSLRKIILNMFSRREFAKNDPAWVLNSLQWTYFEDYTATNEAIYKDMPDSHSLDWEYLKMMHVIFNDADFLTFYVETYAFTGGAHGLQTDEYSVVHTKTGSLLKATDIFIPGYEGGLAVLLTRKLKSVNGLQENQKLSDNGWFTDEIRPNENFYLTDEGIGFHYNPYEIAPYSNGTTDIFLTFGEVDQFLNKNSVISGLIR
jgi:hypothetical protein